MKVLDESAKENGPELGERKRPRKKRADSIAHVDLPLNVEAVHVFSQVGSLAETSRRLNISINDLTRMSRELWWQRELAGIQREQTALENVKLTSMWGRTLDQMGEMLDKGVPIITRNGPLMDEEGRPVYGKMNPTQLAKFAEVLFNQRQLVREMPTAIVGNNSKLEELADKLSALGNARRTRVIDADVQDVRDVGMKEASDGLE